MPRIRPQDVEISWVKLLKPLSHPATKDAQELDTWAFQMEEYFATMPNVTDVQRNYFGRLSAQVSSRQLVARHELASS